MNYLVLTYSLTNTKIVHNKFMLKNLLLMFFVFLSISTMSEESIDDHIECSALYTFLSLVGPISSTKTRLLYDAADFWIEAEMLNAQKHNFEMSKDNLNAVANNKRKLLKDFETFFDNGSLFRIQNDVSLECGVPVPGEYTPEDINCFEISMKKVSQYLDDSGINNKIEQCDALSQTFLYSEVRNKIIKTFRKE